jgi:predicted Mrr-cat superfamily restriction endonuclease
VPTVINRTPISETRNFWVIRSGKDAEYYNHFRLNDVIAIGHTEDLDVGDIEGALSDNDTNTVLSLFQAHYSEINNNKASVSRQVGQVRQFMTLINEGDAVITITSSKVLVGKVTSECYYDETPLRINYIEDAEDCYFPLRYSVEWGQAQAREYIPYIIDKSFRNSGTIFKLTDIDKIRALNDWVNPIHFLENEVRCSINIRSQQALSNREISNLSHVYNQLELLASYLDSIDEISQASVEDFQTYITENCDTFDYQLTTQHEFMSPGFQFIQLKGGYRRNTIFALALSSLFNSQVAFSEEGVSNTVLENKVGELALVIKTPQITHSIESLQAEMQTQIDHEVEFEEPLPSDDAML